MYNYPYNQPRGNPRPATPPFEVTDPNDPQFIAYVSQMNVPSPGGYVPFNQDTCGYGNIPTTPGSMFDGTSFTQPDVDIVQDTQPEGPSDTRKRRVHRKKKDGEPRMKAPQMAWTSEEQMALCKAWVDVTEDPMEANFQKQKTYWKRITERFHNYLDKPPYRDQDVVGSKWRKMRPQIQAYNQIYTRMSQANQHQSGASDAEIQANALAEYQALYPAFGLMQEWSFLRRSSKFDQLMEKDVRKTRGEPTAKRSKTSSSGGIQSTGSDARINIDLNEVEEEGETDRYIRPTGRDAAKKAAYGGSSSSGKAVYSEDFERLGERIDSLLELGKERLQLKKEKEQRENERREREKQKEIREDLKILRADYSHLDGLERQLAEQLKKQIMDKYGYNN